MVRILLTSLAALALQSCVIYDEDATVRLNWTFSGAATCGEAGVQFVHVEIESFDGDDFEQADLPCEAGFVEFDGNLDNDDYLVRALGFPPAGGPTWVVDNVAIDLHGGFNEFTLVMVPF